MDRGKSGEQDSHIGKVWWRAILVAASEPLEQGASPPLGGLEAAARIWDVPESTRPEQQDQV